MKATPPAPLIRLIRRLESAGFASHDEFPEGGPMSTERLNLWKNGLVVIVGADRGFWYVAAAPSQRGLTRGTANPAGFGTDEWRLALSEPRRQGPMVDADDYPLEEDKIEEYLERESQALVRMLGEMLRACEPDRIERTWERLVELAGTYQHERK